MLLDECVRAYGIYVHQSDDRFNSFPVSKAVIEDWDEFTQFMADFFTHMECPSLRGKVDLEYQWGRCIRVLYMDFGRNGEKATFEIVRIGNEGGLLKVMRTLAKRMADEYSKNHTGALVSKYWEASTSKDWLADACDYLKEYSHLLPSDMTEGGGARLTAGFFKLLQEHPKMMRRLEKVGRV